MELEQLENTCGSLIEPDAPVHITTLEGEGGQGTSGMYKIKNWRKNFDSDTNKVNGSTFSGVKSIISRIMMDFIPHLIPSLEMTP